MDRTEELLRQIPNVDKLMKSEIIADSGVYRHEAADAVRDVLGDLRKKLIAGETGRVPGDGEIARSALELARCRAQKGVRRIINGTGVILHSNLGRACLSIAAAAAAKEAALSYCSLEYDLEAGARGDRTACIEGYLHGITGCEASLIVNNNAAAVLLALTAVAQGGNVVVSRGELVEIGGGFRVPDIIAQCGCTLREAGTTNKTRISDYDRLIDDDTRALIKIHTSNFKIIGFTETAALKDLAALGAKRGIPLIEDIGSATPVNMEKYGIYGETQVSQSLNAGVDIVTFSGDKLLGGPQCGIVLGREKYIAAMKKHPLYRALRTDKMVIAALEATLRVYSDPRVAEREIPVLAMLSQSGGDLRVRAERLCGEIRLRGGSVEIVDSKSVAGGGAIPGMELDSCAISPSGGKSADEYECALRMLPVPIIGHIVDDRLLLDVRTMFEQDFDYIAESVADITRSSR